MLVATQRILLNESMYRKMRRGLAAYFPLAEASGTRYDLSGNLNSLTDNNTVTGNPGPSNGALRDASQFVNLNSESLTIADNAIMSTGDIDFTVACWVYLDTLTADRAVGGKGAAGIDEWALRYQRLVDDPSSRFTFYIDSNNVAQRANSFGGPAAATWYFIVCWHDSVANTINIQVNDGAVDSAGTGAFTPPDTASAFFLGGGSNLTFMDGRLAGFGFWKRVLSPAERTWLYNNGVPQNLARYA